MRNATFTLAACLPLALALCAQSSPAQPTTDQPTPTQPESQSQGQPEGQPQGWPEGSQADASTFASFALTGSDVATLPPTWPRRVTPPNHPTRWFHSVEVFQPKGLMPNPQRTFAREGQAEMLAARATLDAQRVARALGMSDADIAPGPQSKLPKVVPYTTGAFLVALREAQANEELTPRTARQVLAGIRVVSVRETPDSAWMPDSTSFLAYAPRTLEPANAKGTVLIMPGLLGTPEGPLLSLARVLQAEGFVVLQMVAQPARFIEQTPMLIREDNPTASIAEIASVLDERSAECAYSVASAFAQLEALVPSLAHKPRAAIGFSGGAITLPTVVALEPTRYRAAVLVGGGTNFFHMIDTSNYTSFLGGAGPTWPSPKAAETSTTSDDLKQTLASSLAALKLRTYRDFLQHASLDAFHTADALRTIPTLSIYGTVDEAVPSPLADQLWHRLGRKDRETYPVGHELLFAQLPQRNKAITTWLTTALAADQPPSP
jgi:hypothetical protein